MKLKIDKIYLVFGAILVFFIISKDNIFTSGIMFFVLLLILFFAVKNIAEDINLSEFENLIELGSKFKDICKNSLSKNNDILNKKHTPAIIIKSANYAVANLIIDGKNNYYYAYSSSKINESLKKDKIKIPDGIICNDINIVKHKLPMKRLSPKLEWVEFEESGFAEEKLNCCERRILAQILTSFNKDTLKGKKLHIYTKYEPCLYCYYTLKEIQEGYGVDVNVYYAQMLPEIKLSKNIEEENFTNFLNKFAYDEKDKDIINNDLNIKN